MELKMDSYFEVQLDSQNSGFITKQESYEVQIKVTFQESFPYQELTDLISIIENASPLVRSYVLPTAIEVANRMQKRFSNSLSEDYYNWVICVHNGLEKLNLFMKELHATGMPLPIK